MTCRGSPDPSQTDSSAVMALKRGFGAIKLSLPSAPKKKKDPQKMLNVTANCYFVENEDIYTSFIQLKHASFSAAFQCLHDVDEAQLGSIISTAIANGRPLLQSCRWCLLHRDQNRRQWFQAFPDDMKKDGPPTTREKHALLAKA
ncbi:hypothetical protein Bbelb_350410 [Branchiostoma belcheri]|nr:hypothetical protein Bbelb_350410 [Branchiostoma belcheri]